MAQMTFRNIFGWAVLIQPSLKRDGVLSGERDVKPEGICCQGDSPLALKTEGPQDKSCRHSQGDDSE